MNSGSINLLPLGGVLEAAIYSDDLEAAKTFYGDLLGLEKVVEREDHHVFFRCGSTIVLIFNAAKTRIQKPVGRFPVPAHGTKGASHICFSATRAQIKLWKSRLIEHDVEIEAEITWPNGALSVYFRDPNGNSLEIAQPALWGYEEKEMTI